MPAKDTSEQSLEVFFFYFVLPSFVRFRRPPTASRLRAAPSSGLIFEHKVHGDKIKKSGNSDMLAAMFLIQTGMPRSLYLLQVAITMHIYEFLSKNRHVIARDTKDSCCHI